MLPASSKASNHDVNIEILLSKATGILSRVRALCRESTRISKSFKVCRELLIYIAWQLAVTNSREIGNKFGLRYSAVRQR